MNFKQLILVLTVMLFATACTKSSSDVQPNSPVPEVDLPITAANIAGNYKLEDVKVGNFNLTYTQVYTAGSTVVTTQPVIGCDGSRVWSFTSTSLNFSSTSCSTPSVSITMPSLNAITYSLNWGQPGNARPVSFDMGDQFIVMRVTNQHLWIQWSGNNSYLGLSTGTKYFRYVRQ